VIAVYVVTYRRPALLKRALESVRAQTFQHWQARVVNDDPADGSVGALVESIGDPRIRLYGPQQKRGAARAFNEAFRAVDCEFSSLLEDDNWWDRGFLQRMFEVLQSNPRVDIACGNEKIWRECGDGRWQDTGQTVWSFSGLKEYTTEPENACGSSMLCNSSMLVRRKGRPEYVTPDDIPVDVTEHFRERCIRQPMVLVGDTLANYSQTIVTHRSTRGGLWGDYQAMLTATAFSSLTPRRREIIAEKIFAGLGSAPNPRASSMMSAALSSRDARPLWHRASRVQKLRFVAGLARRPQAFYRLKTLRHRCREHWEFLLNSFCNRLWQEEIQG